MDTDPLGASERILPAGPAYAGVVGGGAVSETGNRKPARQALGRVDRAGLVHRPPGAAVCHRRAFNNAPRSAFGCTWHTGQSDTSVAVGSFAGRHSPWGNGPGGSGQRGSLCWRGRQQSRYRTSQSRPLESRQQAHQAEPGLLPLEPLASLPPRQVHRQPQRPQKRQSMHESWAEAIGVAV